jgi:hypothetical protein
MSKIPDSVILMTSQRMHRLALLRGYHFHTNLFKNPSWLIMLNLFVNEMEKLTTTTAALKMANRLTDEELRSTLDQLTDAGMVEIDDDELVALTPLASKQMDGFIREILKSRESEG